MRSVHFVARWLSRGWMSGAGEYIVYIETRMDDTDVLANDGSALNFLASVAHVIDVVAFVFTWSL
jgi:signal transduction histidine kinase